jgi:hypothetical protein
MSSRGNFARSAMPARFWLGRKKLVTGLRRRHVRDGEPYVCGAGRADLPGVGRFAEDRRIAETRAASIAGFFADARSHREALEIVERQRSRADCGDIWRSFPRLSASPAKGTIYRVRGSPAHRVERLQRQASAMRLVSTVMVLVLASALHQPRSPWHQDAKVVSRWDGTICEGEFGAAPLSSEIGLTRDAGCRAPRPIGRAPTPDPQLRASADVPGAFLRLPSASSAIRHPKRRRCSTRITTIPQFRV